VKLRLGDRTYDLATRALVMGVLNRTPDSFYDHGLTFALDALLERAAMLVAQGADVLDVGGVKAGPGPEVSELEEFDRVVPAVEALHDRFDVPVSVDTWRAAVARASYAAGAVMGNDISGFADARYLAPRVPDPDPHYTDVVREVASFLEERSGQARAAGIAGDRIVIDAGLDLGKTPPQSVELLRRTDVLGGLGYPVMLSASNKTFLGTTLDLGIDERGDASLAATAIGVSLGCRLVRAHDVAGTRRVCDAVAAVLEAS
jgi:dihydropteroate synthase